MPKTLIRLRNFHRQERGKRTVRRDCSIHSLISTTSVFSPLITHHKRRMSHLARVTEGTLATLMLRSRGDDEDEEDDDDGERVAFDEQQQDCATFASQQPRQQVLTTQPRKRQFCRSRTMPVKNSLGHAHERFSAPSDMLHSDRVGGCFNALCLLSRCTSL